MSEAGPERPANGASAANAARRAARVTADRLSSTLFVAALAHGVLILGVTFTSGPSDESAAPPSLNVTLVVDTNALDRPPEDTEWLAQVNQAGGGRAAEGLRPTTTLAGSAPASRDGTVEGADALDAQSQEPAPSAKQLVTQSPSDRRVQGLPSAAETPAAASAKTAAAMLDRAAQQTLAMEIDARAALPDGDDSDRLPSPTTRESILAAYLDAWRRRVERVGTANFPASLVGQPGLARPTLEVAIAADGRLEDIVVRRSSGDPRLDQAALTILRLAAPFEPLPAEIKAQYDVLRFAYEWDFSGGTAGVKAR